MQKIPALALLAAFLFPACAAPPKSGAWLLVKSVRHAGPAEIPADAAFAAKLHRTLQHAHIEHKIVTAKFRYQSRIVQNLEGVETAVIYRDAATPAHPWWAMAERLARPEWLPSGPLRTQAAFFFRRPVVLVRVEEFSASAEECARKNPAGAKVVLQPFRPKPSLPRPWRRGRISLASFLN